MEVAATEIRVVINVVRRMVRMRSRVVAEMEAMALTAMAAGVKEAGVKEAGMETDNPSRL